MNKHYEIDLKLYEQSPKNSGIEFVQGDSGVYSVGITLLGRGGEPFVIPEGASAALNFLLPPKNAPRPERGFAEIVDRAAGKLLYTVNGTEISAPGKALASVEITDGEDSLSWQNFEFRVTKSLKDDAAAETAGAYAGWAALVEQRLSGLEGNGGPGDEDWKSYMANVVEITCKPGDIVKIAASTGWEMTYNGVSSSVGGQVLVEINFNQVTFSDGEIVTGTAVGFVAIPSNNFSWETVEYYWGEPGVTELAFRIGNLDGAYDPLAKICVTHYENPLVRGLGGGIVDVG